MANPLYESLRPGTVQNSGVVPQMNMQDAMTKLKSNPAMMIRQAGFNVPDNISNDPQSIVTYLIQSGQVSSPMLQKIRPLISQMMGY